VISHLVVPDCRTPDDRHEPPGKRGAAYLYEWHDKWSGLDLCWDLCVECCARIRMLSERPDPAVFAPPPVSIRVLRDPNTGELAVLDRHVVIDERA
jgi:hypothetical protein